MDNKRMTRLGTYVHTLSTPVDYNNVTYTKLTFHFDQLTGKDDLLVESEMQTLGKPLIVAEFSGEYLGRMAVRACEDKIGFDLLEKLPMRDFRAIRKRARSFLLWSESAAETEEPGSDDNA